MEERFAEVQDQTNGNANRRELSADLRKFCEKMWGNGDDDVGEIAADGEFSYVRDLVDGRVFDDGGLAGKLSESSDCATRRAKRSVPTMRTRAAAFSRE